MKNLFCIFTLLISAGIAKADGGSSGVGGAPIVSQAAELKMLLKDPDFLFSFSSLKISTIRSIENVGFDVEKRASLYKVTSNGGCVMDVTFVNIAPKESWDVQLQLQLGQWTCPAE